MSAALKRRLDRLEALSNDGKVTLEDAVLWSMRYQEVSDAGGTFTARSSVNTTNSSGAGTRNTAEFGAPQTAQPARQQSLRLSNPPSPPLRTRPSVLAESRQAQRAHAKAIALTRGIGAPIVSGKR